MSAGCLAFLYAACFGLYLNDPSYHVSDWRREGIIAGSLLLVSGWFFQVVLSHGVALAAAAGSRPSSRRDRFSHWRQIVSVRQTCWTIVILGLFYGLSQGLSLAHSYSAYAYGLREALSQGLRQGMSFGAVIVLLFIILDENSNTLKLAEQISWTWRPLLRLRHLRASLLVTMIMGCFLGLSNALGDMPSDALSDVLSGMLSDALSYGLGVGLSYWLLLGLYQGMIQKHLEDRDRRRFNQGLHRSLHNSLLLSLLGGGLLVGISLLSGGLSYGLDNALIYELSYGLDNALGNALNARLLLFVCGWFALWAMIGGLAILRHYTLRVLLARSHTFPLNARRFLDDAVVRAFLKCSGGGYAFVHRRLLDYCADTADKITATEKKA